MYTQHTNTRITCLNINLACGWPNYTICYLNPHNSWRRMNAWTTIWFGISSNELICLLISITLIVLYLVRCTTKYGTNTYKCLHTDTSGNHNFLGQFCEGLKLFEVGDELESLGLLTGSLDSWMSAAYLKTTLSRWDAYQEHHLSKDIICHIKIGDNIKLPDKSRST